MNRDEAQPLPEMGRAAIARDRQGLPGQGQDGGCTQGDDEMRVHEIQLTLEPPAIVPDLPGCRPLVYPPLAALLELEVLDGIGQVAGAPYRLRIEGVTSPQTGASHEP